jgi:site-specific DNA recombinase
VQRWNLPDGWVISSRPAPPALVSEADFIAAQDLNAACGPVPQGCPVLRRYLLARLLACGVCGRRMESAWSNGRPAYRCRHGHAFAPFAGWDEVLFV